MVEKKLSGVDRLRLLVEDNHAAIERDPTVKEKLESAMKRLSAIAEDAAGKGRDIPDLLGKVTTGVELLGAADLEDENDEKELQKQLSRIKEDVTALLADLDALETERLGLAAQAAAASAPPEQGGGGTPEPKIKRGEKKETDGNLPVEDPYLRAVFEKKNWVVRLDDKRKKTLFKHNGDTGDYQEIPLSKILAAADKVEKYTDESGREVLVAPLDRDVKVRDFFGVEEKGVPAKPAKRAAAPAAPSRPLEGTRKKDADRDRVEDKKESDLLPRAVIENHDAFFSLDTAAQLKAVSSFAANGDIDPLVRLSLLQELKKGIVARSDVDVAVETNGKVESSIERCKGLAVAELGRTIKRFDGEIDDLSSRRDRAVGDEQKRIIEQIEKKEKLFIQNARYLEQILVNYLLHKKNAKLAEIAADTLCQFCDDESIASIKNTIKNSLKGKNREDIEALQGLLKKFESAPAASEEEPLETLSQAEADDAALDFKELQRDPNFKAAQLPLAEKKRYIQAIHQTKKYTNAQKLLALKLFIDTRPQDGNEKSIQKILDEKFREVSASALIEISAAVRRCGERLSALRRNDSLSEVQRATQKTALETESFVRLQELENVFLYLPPKDREAAAIAATQAGHYAGGKKSFVENLEGQKTAGYGDAAEIDRLIVLCQQELARLQEVEKAEAAVVHDKKAVHTPKPLGKAPAPVAKAPVPATKPGSDVAAPVPAPADVRPRTRKEGILEYYSSDKFLALSPKEQADGLVEINQNDGISPYEKFTALKSILLALPESSPAREVANRLTVEQGTASIKNHVWRIGRYEKSSESVDQEKVTGSIKSLRRFARDLEAPPEVAMRAIEELENLKRSFKRSSRIFFEDRLEEKEISPLEKKHAKELIAFLDAKFPGLKPQPKRDEPKLRTPDVAAPARIDIKRILENDKYLQDPDLFFDLTVSEQEEVMDSIMRERHEKSSEVLSFLHAVSLESTRDRSDWGKTIRRLYNGFKNELAGTLMDAASDFEAKVSGALDVDEKEDAKRNLTVSLNRLSSLLQRHFLFDKYPEKRGEIMKFFLQKGEIEQFKNFKEHLESHLEDVRKDFESGEGDMREPVFLRFQKNVEWCIRRLEHKISILENPGAPRPPEPTPDASRGLPLDELTGLDEVIEKAIDNGDRDAILLKKRELLGRMATPPDHVLEMLNKGIHEADKVSINNCVVGDTEDEQRLIDYITRNTIRFPELSDDVAKFAILHARDTGNRYVLEEAKQVYETAPRTSATTEFLKLIDVALALAKTPTKAGEVRGLSDAPDEEKGPRFVDRLKELGQLPGKFLSSLSGLFSRREVDVRRINPQFLPDSSRGTLAARREQEALDVLFRAAQDSEGVDASPPRRASAPVVRERERPKPPVRGARSASAPTPTRSAKSVPATPGTERRASVGTPRARSTSTPDRPAIAAKKSGWTWKKVVGGLALSAGLGGGVSYVASKEKEPPKLESATSSPTPTPEPTATPSPETSVSPVRSSTGTARSTESTPERREVTPGSVVENIDLLRDFDSWESALTTNQMAAIEDMRIFPADKKEEVRKNVRGALEHTKEQVGAAFSESYRTVVNEAVGSIVTELVQEKKLPQDFVSLLKAEVARRAYEKSSKIDRERGAKKSPDTLRSALDEQGKKDFDLRQFTKEVGLLVKNTAFKKELGSLAEQYAKLLGEYSGSVEGAILVQEIVAKGSSDALLPKPALLQSKADMLGLFAKLASDSMTPADSSLSDAAQKKMTQQQERATRVTRKPLALLLGAKSFESSN